MPEVGDRVEVPSKRVGQAPRQGVVTAVRGALLRIAWTTGEESTVMPSMGSLVVVGRGRAPARPATGGATKPRGSRTGAPSTTGRAGSGKREAAPTKALATAVKKKSTTAATQKRSTAPAGKTGKSPGKKSTQAAVKKGATASSAKSGSKAKKSSGAKRKK